MALWMVRAGSHGEREDYALDNNVVVIGWEEIQKDLSIIKSRQALEAILDEVYPDIGDHTKSNWLGQIWAFLDKIQMGDLVALPLKRRAAIAIGRITGPYEYHPENTEDIRHLRQVEWIRKDIPRSSFDQDVLYSLGAFKTVCQVQRNKAEERIRALLKGQSIQTNTTSANTATEYMLGDDGAAPLILDEYARDQIVNYIGRKFKGHELSRLVTALLEAQGYQTRMSPAGPDGGIDIVAGGGAMGFDSPRLVVQVKSSDQPIDVRPFRELKGVMNDFNAEQGLLVAWGGFNRAVLSEANRLFFTIRLWDSGDLVDALLDNYELLPADIQAELPLKRIWTLVLED